MANRGTLEEQEIAKRIIDQSGISIHEIVKKDCIFKYKNELERRLIHQISSVVLNGEDGKCFTLKDRKKIVGFVLTESQNQEFELLFSIYKRELEKEIKFTYEAFVQKNKIFSQIELDRESDYREELNPDEKVRLYKLRTRMESMDKTQIREQLS